MLVPLTPSADKNWITVRWACLEESMARSLTVISLLLQSTTHYRYRVYTEFLLTYTAIYRGNRKVLPLGITALQPQSHFHLGTPYSLSFHRTEDRWIVPTLSVVWSLWYISQNWWEEVQITENAWVWRAYTIVSTVNSTYPNSGYPDRLGPWGKFIKNSI